MLEDQSRLLRVVGAKIRRRFKKKSITVATVILVPPWSGDRRRSSCSRRNYWVTRRRSGNQSRIKQRKSGEVMHLGAPPHQSNLRPAVIMGFNVVRKLWRSRSLAHIIRDSPREARRLVGFFTAASAEGAMKCSSVKLPKTLHDRRRRHRLDGLRRKTTPTVSSTCMKGIVTTIRRRPYYAIQRSRGRYV